MNQILIFNDSLHFGGTETLLVNIINNLAEKDCCITLLLPVPDKENVLLKEVSDKITVRYIYPDGLCYRKKVVYENLMSFFPSLYLKIINLNLNAYDLIISFKDSAYSIIFTQTRHRKILWIHNLPIRRNYGIHSAKEWLAVSLLKIRTRRLEKSFRRYNDVVCVSNAVKDRYTEIFNDGRLIKGQILHVIYNAVDFAKIGKLSRTPFQLSEPRPVFLLATRLSVEKRVDRVIEAAKRLKENGYKFHIIILGDGSYFEDIQKQISAYSLENEISMKGYYPNPYPCMKAADWLICSSEKESFSLVLLESIYLGTPVITTDCGGPTEISENGKYALLTDNSSEGVYQGMKKVLDSPDISLQFTARADDCLKRFNYSEWLENINRLLGVRS